MSTLRAVDQNKDTECIVNSVESGKPQTPNELSTIDPPTRKSKPVSPKTRELEHPGKIPRKPVSEPLKSETPYNPKP